MRYVKAEILDIFSEIEECLKEIKDIAVTIQRNSDCFEARARAEKIEDNVQEMLRSLR